MSYLEAYLAQHVDNIAFVQGELVLVRGFVSVRHLTVLFSCGNQNIGFYYRLKTQREITSTLLNSPCHHICLFTKRRKILNSIYISRATSGMFLCFSARYCDVRSTGSLPSVLHQFLTQFLTPSELHIKQKNVNL